MLTYDPNPPVGPIGYQPVEFLDIAPMTESLDTAAAVDRADGTGAHSAVIHLLQAWQRTPELSP
jgi:hypothetical protein